MTKPVLKGSWVALVTPFNNGRIDRERLIGLIEKHIESRTDGIVICGTTGESPVLSIDEKAFLMEVAAERVAGKIPLMFGTGGNNTAQSVELTRRAGGLGAQFVLVVTPYYNKPTQGGLIAHYKEIAAATSLPVVLYNVPGRTGVNLVAQTTLELAKIANIVAVKEASGNIAQAMEIIRNAPAGFSLLSGEDALNLPLMSVGASGTISVTANVAPALMKKFNDACLDARWDEARNIHYRLLNLHHALFLESNPIPVKAALEIQKLIGSELRLPLVPASENTRERLSSILKELGEEI